MEDVRGHLAASFNYVAIFTVVVGDLGRTIRLSRDVDRVSRGTLEQVSIGSQV